MLYLTGIDIDIRLEFFLQLSFDDKKRRKKKVIKNASTFWRKWSKAKQYKRASLSTSARQLF